MQKITCEMCGSNNIVKEGEFFVCQNCGTKYSPEAAKKMYDATIKITEPVKIDNNEEINNLNVLLDRAIINKQWTDVSKYSIEILHSEPNNWKAIFYKELGEAWNAKYYNRREYIDLINAARTAVDLIEQDDGDLNIDVIKNSLGEQLVNIAQNSVDPALKNTHNGQGIKNLWTTLQTGIELEEYALELVKPEYYLNIYKDIVNYAIELKADRYYGEYTAKPNSNTKDFAENKKNFYTAKIQEIDPEYKPNDGCFIATAVYGSYDCPEVWTLRRFRDNTLYPTIPGQIFIKTYYTISPTLVKYFGDKKWFVKLFRKPLNYIVSKLQRAGVESTCYIDKHD
ncbi:MAG: DUF2318 domain-containing protein [Methanosphaera sp.]|nr:DUF2318 domain-containing protein [Methanosphaera sp.]